MSNSSLLWTPILNLSTPSQQLIAQFYRYENVTILIFQFIALILFINLLLYSQFYGGKLGKKIQPTFRLFLLFHSIGILTSLPASIHKVFSILDPSKSLNLLFWIFSFSGNYIPSIGPFFELFLTIERFAPNKRIIFIKFPFILPKYSKYYLLIVTLLAIFLYSITFSFFIAELPLNTEIALKCAPLICIAPKFKFIPQLVSTFTYGICNLIFNFIFFYIVNAELAKKIKFRVVKFTIISDICMNICPTIVGLIWTWLTGKALSQFVGPLDLTMANVDLAICSIFYSWIYLVVARKQKMEKKRIIIGIENK